MCSVAWRYQPTGYELVFNRDELWSRERSGDISFESDHLVPGFCARDTDAGGTWLFANVAGLTCCLLNAYPIDKPIARGRRTRGEIPLLAGECESMGELIEALEVEQWSDFSPCELLLVDDESVARFVWDGELFQRCAIEEPFLTSSSVRSVDVVGARRSRYRALKSEPLVKILSDTGAAAPEEAIYVTRSDGGTVSQTRIVVTSHQVQAGMAHRGEEASELSQHRRSR